ncbi:MAG: hypothetical protein ABIP35_09465 [Ginsengibacter sp.]
MKKIVLLQLIIVVLSSQLFAQTKDDYLLKSNHQKTAAWVMLGGGTALLAVGGIIGIHSFSNLLTGQFEKAGNTLGLASILSITGGAAMLGSIPFFIASSKNKHKAVSLALGSQPMPALLKNITGRAFIPSLNVQISL